MSKLLRVKDLVISSPEREGRGAEVLLDGISFDLGVGEAVGIVAPSGAGKSILARALLGLLPSGFRLVRGSIQLEGAELAALAESKWRALRGHRIALVPQHPSAALDPLFTIGRQIEEVLAAHRIVASHQRKERVLELLTRVEMPQPELRARQFPHQLSGGQQQRAVLALALAGDPRLLLADEPTTALDVTVQAKILALLAKLRRESGLGLLLMTHDLAVVAALCDRVLVLHHGAIVEQGPVEEVFGHPENPFTRELLDAARNLQPFRRMGRSVEALTGREPTVP